MDKVLKDIKVIVKKALKKLRSTFNFKDSEKRKNVIYLFAVLGVLIIITTIYLFATKNISSIEKNTLIKQSEDISSYFEYIDNKKPSNDDYILFALKYSNDNNTKSILSSSEISELISSKINKNISAEDIKNTGITEKLLNESVVYNPGEDTYEISIARKTAGVIAETAIPYYNVKKVSKVNKKKYNIVYQKYIIDNPYNVLNYYIDYNSKNDDVIDINPYRNYLSGSSSLYSFKQAIKSDDIEKYANKDYKIKVTYVVKDDKILVDKISRCTLC